MPHPLIADQPLRLVSNGEGGYRLLMRHPTTQDILTIAEVHAAAAGEDDLARIFARLFAAAPPMLHLIDTLLEEVQPDGWDAHSDQGAIWVRAFRVLAQATPEARHP